MKKIAWLVSSFTFCLYGSLIAQTEQQEQKVVFERLNDSLFTFYFDSQYYLTDKDCEFFAITRESGYNSSLKNFEGSFTDYDADGHIILTGHYKNGLKDGAFKAFYPGSFLKWQAEFKNGKATGTWYFYYPDGRPQCILQINGNRVTLTNSWNNRGKPVIQNGTGKFELVDPAFGFNEQGYEAIVYNGRFKNGYPDGNWRISYKYSDKSVEAFAIEEFDNGTFKKGLDMEKYRPYTASRIQMIPSEPYINAEKFISKNCSIDEHYNYTVYLSETLTKNILTAPEHTGTSRSISFSLTVDQKGRPSRISLVQPTEDTLLDKALLQAIWSIPYWIPSQKDGRLIIDMLTVKTDLITNTDGKSFFSNTRIERANGS